MPTCTLGDGGPAYDRPPLEIEAVNPTLYAYLLAVHRRVFGLPDGGDLDSANINGAALTNIDHRTLTNVLPYQHHGAGEHQQLDQGVAVADPGSAGTIASAPAPASAVAVTSPNAGGAYTAAEQTLINELKTDLNALVAGVNLIATAVNGTVADVVAVHAALAGIRGTLAELVAAMRAANLLAT